MKLTNRLFHYYERGLYVLRNKCVVKSDSNLYTPKGGVSGQDASDLIYAKLNEDAPCMISRFGSVELTAVTRCLAHRGFFLRRVSNFINGRSAFPHYEPSIFEQLKNNAGFFSANRRSIEQFTDLYISAIGNIDILGSWLEDEKYVESYFPQNMKRITLGGIEPYFASNPWSRILKGKKVLVVHPFSKTIESQYERHALLFPCTDVLPDFELKTVQAVQTIAGAKTEYGDWFAALDYMKDKIQNTDFDVALIGCGAYGMPLASFVKELGKKSVHMGGATQILFGIRGKRWDEREDFKTFFNEQWVYPLDSETPKNAKLVEGGCYW